MKLRVSPVSGMALFDDCQYMQDVSKGVDRLWILLLAILHASFCWNKY